VVSPCIIFFCGCSAAPSPVLRPDVRQTVVCDTTKL